jgi:NADH-quinone oxidoreductase subunit A
MLLAYANVLVFLLVGIGFVIVNVSVISRLLRPKVENAEKSEIYECGEPVIGSAWVRFDMRFYTIALVFLVFDVEIAFIYPWAVVFRTLQHSGLFALTEMLVFLAILAVGFIYAWRRGDLDWVKSSAALSTGDGAKRKAA